MNRTQDRAALWTRLRSLRSTTPAQGLLTGLFAVGAYLLAQRLFPHTRLLWAFAAALTHFALASSQIGAWSEEAEGRLKRLSPSTPVNRAFLLLLNLLTRLLLIHAIIETVGMPWRGFLLAPIVGQTLLAASRPHGDAPRPWLPFLLSLILLLCVLLACIGLAAILWLAAALALGLMLRRLSPASATAYAFLAENAEILTLLLLATRAADLLL